MRILRKIAAVITGLVVAWLAVSGAEAIVHKMYPPPLGTNMHDMKAIKKFVSTLPPLAFVLVLLGWLIATLAGTFVAAKIGRSAVPGYIVGAILLAAGIANSIIIPQPVWFSALSFVIYIAMTIVGSRAPVPAVRSPV